MLTVNENILGLLKIWSEIKNNYPYQNKLDDINWDMKVIDYIEKMSVELTLEEYYMILIEFCSFVNDGHTNVIPPWEHIVPGHNKPAIEVELIDNKLVIYRIGNKQEYVDHELCLGDEILSIDDIPVLEKFTQLNKIYARGSEQANQVINMFFILMGPISNPIKLKIKDLKGKMRMIELQRSPVEDDGKYFMDRMIDLRNPLRITYFLDTALIKISNFKDIAIADKVKEIIFSKDIRHIIFDLRFNMGGNDQIAYSMISSLIKEDACSPTFKYKVGSPALRNWGIPDEWKENFTTIHPDEHIEVNKNIYVLTNGATSSTAEDFVVVLKHIKRATIIGTKTAGSSGNPYAVNLPYGGKLRVSTFVATTPDRVEYVGIGIDPNIEVKQSIEDLKKGIDTQLEYVLNLIKSNKDK